MTCYSTNCWPTGLSNNGDIADKTGSTQERLKWSKVKQATTRTAARPGFIPPWKSATAHLLCPTTVRFLSQFQLPCIASLHNEYTSGAACVPHLPYPCHESARSRPFARPGSSRKNRISAYPPQINHCSVASMWRHDIRQLAKIIPHRPLCCAPAPWPCTALRRQFSAGRRRSCLPEAKLRRRRN